MNSLKRNILFFFILLNSHNIYSQDCNCKNNLLHLIEIAENNYAGFFDKLNNFNKEYYSFKDSLLLSLNQAADLDYTCYLKLKKYIKFFSDPHLSLSFKTSQQKERVKLFFKETGPFFNLASVKGVSSGSLKKIEGLWTDESNSFILQVQAVSKDSLVGYIKSSDEIYWHPSQVKIEIKKHKGNYLLKYYTRDHTIIIDSSQNIEQEIKVFSQLPLLRVENNRRNGSFQFKKITSKIGYFKLPDFFPQNFKIIDSLFNVYKKSQNGLKYLILDIRNNSGGSNIASMPFVRLFYTDSIPLYGGFVRSSPENIKVHELTAMDTLYPPLTRQYFKALADTMAMYPNSMVRTSYASHFTLDSVYKMPEKVIMLINDRSFSAGEYFAYYGSFSKKCILMGKETYGAINYVNVNSGISLPCNFININYPINKSERADVKGLSRGIKPQIELKIPEAGWVNYAADYLKGLSK